MSSTPQPTIAKTSLYGNDETKSWTWAMQVAVPALGGDKSASIEVSARVVRIEGHVQSVDLGVGWTHRGPKQKYAQRLPGIPESNERLPPEARAQAQEAIREAAAWLAKEVA